MDDPLLSFGVRCSMLDVRVRVLPGKPRIPPGTGKEPLQPAHVVRQVALIDQTQALPVYRNILQVTYLQLVRIESSCFAD